MVWKPCTVLELETTAQNPVKQVLAETSTQVLHNRPIGKWG